uniref:Uncharacterized protein n=1 Tax=Arundo donax TaxID=35708 RepID=A0A0A9S6H8_ARUDO
MPRISIRGERVHMAEPLKHRKKVYRERGGVATREEWGGLHTDTK